MLLILELLAAIICLVLGIILLNQSDTIRIKNEIYNEVKGFNIDLNRIDSINHSYVNHLVNINGLACFNDTTKVLLNFIDNSTDNLSIQYIYEKNKKKSYKYESLPWGVCNQYNNIIIDINNNLWNNVIGDSKDDFLYRREFYSQSNEFIKSITDSITVLGGYIDGGTHEYKRTWYQYIFGLPNDKTHTRLLKCDTPVGIIGQLKYIDGKYIIDEHMYFGEIYFGYVDFDFLTYDNIVIQKIINQRHTELYILSIILLIMFCIITIIIIITNIKFIDVKDQYQSIRVTNYDIEMNDLFRPNRQYLNSTNSNINDNVTNFDIFEMNDLFRPNRQYLNSTNSNINYNGNYKTFSQSTFETSAQLTFNDIDYIAKCNHCDRKVLSCTSTCSKCCGIVCTSCTEKCRHCNYTVCKVRKYWFNLERHMICPNEQCNKSQAYGCGCSNCKGTVTKLSTKCNNCKSIRCDSCLEKCRHCRSILCKDCWIIKDGYKICAISACLRAQTRGCGCSNQCSNYAALINECRHCTKPRCDNSTSNCIHCRKNICNNCWVIRDGHKICPRNECLRSQTRGCGCSNHCTSYVSLTNNNCKKCYKLRCDDSSSDCVHCRNNICNNCWVIRDGHKICPRNECLRSQTRGCGCSNHCTSYVLLTDDYCRNCYQLRCDYSTSDCIHCKNKICNNCWEYDGYVKTCPLQECYQSQILCKVCNELVIGENLVDCQSCNKIVCSKCSNNNICFKCLTTNCPQCSNTMIKTVNTNRCQLCRISVCNDCYQFCYKCEKKYCSNCCTYHSKYNNYKCKRKCWRKLKNNNEKLKQNEIICSNQSCGNVIANKNKHFCPNCSQNYCYLCTRSCTSCNKKICNGCWKHEYRKHQGDDCSICPMCNTNNNPKECPICYENITSDNEEINCPFCEHHYDIKCFVKLIECAICRKEL